MSSPPDRLALADAASALADAVLQLAPGLSRLLEERRRHPWHEVPATERRVHLLAAHLQVDPDSPAVRRRVRILSRELESEAAESDDRIRDDMADYNPAWDEPAAMEIPDRHRAKVAAWLRTVESDVLLSELRRVAGVHAAHRLLRKELPGVGENTALRYLRSLGYPAATLEAPKLRFLRRFGLLDAPEKSTAERDLGLRALSTMAESGALPLDELDLLLNVFTGMERRHGRAAAWCDVKPKCPTCPLRGHCPTYRYAGHLVAESSESAMPTLQEMLRPEDRPREKLKHGGAESLSDAELLAILLRTGGDGENALTLAARILRERESLSRIAAASVSELAAMKGVGEVKAITIKAALELSRRLRETDFRLSGPLNTADDVFRLLHPRFIGKKKEQFLALLLDTKHHLIRIVTVSEGTLNESLVHPREAFNDAIRDHASAVIFAHNHPSGDPEPSRADLLITDRLQQAGDIVGVRVLDHVIIGKDCYYSMRERDLMK